MRSLMCMFLISFSQQVLKKTFHVRVTITKLLKVHSSTTLPVNIISLKSQM
jgi:hypothetical protein